ncbi:MAG TPA: hypothetical protein DCQ26_11790 [Marinilabiliales bacterium]|nr:MAG: hypothetical protein A2W95_18535 [Bacteroidetes bacterium GWA2_40_14]OFX62565.1 MAG: hypothetical protein A2W84_08500 [Bacteroidetes bacterium GWC2_40_13]OFX72647.1 MAG: hypothetical protein A2W96_01645 [Bacteroidetes bacterium GWD2_40_43]OFX91068.1 MAG: hypothetical protein A2W97_15610 [Bacteroidetes bacterium GWE2_40_63]OFY23595.1 MAG: hypothetical protein A2W88_05660 [Bacteroidetes bacterium GWF2_40_13]OFZ25806.1 MAG: hypothetical protein A2437_00140 [Bacteroidetes bacterium RIFOXYC
MLLFCKQLPKIEELFAFKKFICPVPKNSHLSKIEPRSDKIRFILGGFQNRFSNFVPGFYD